MSVLLSISDNSLPMPAGGILLSPWVDLAENTNASWEINKNIDYLPPDLAYLFAESYKGPTSTWEAVSPTLSKNLGVLPPCLVLYGECECLSEQIETFCAKCISAGVKLEKLVAVDMVHVYPLFTFSGLKQCEEAFDQMNEFISRLIPIKE